MEHRCGCDAGSAARLPVSFGRTYPTKHDKPAALVGRNRPGDLTDGYDAAGRRRGRAGPSAPRVCLADVAVAARAPDRAGAARAPICVEYAAMRSMISRARYCSIPTLRLLVPTTATIALSPAA